MGVIIVGVLDEDMSSEKPLDESTLGMKHR
jgi:hypothetical protein